MPEALRVKGVSAKTGLIEHLVEKRVRTLEYYRLLHTREDVLWMNTVRLGKSDICSYFGVDPSVSDPRGTQQKASRIRIRHVRTESMGSAATSNANHAASSVGDMHMTPDTTIHLERTGMATTVAQSWLDENLPALFAAGSALAELLLVPLSGGDFVDAVYQVFLELDVVFASGSTARVLAGRTLKNHRWARAQAAQRLAAAEGNPNAASSPDEAVVSAKPHYLDEVLMSLTPSPPSYDLLIPSLCSTLIFVYRRMCDFDATEDTDCVKQILVVDRRIKRLVIGNLSKELQKLAKVRMVQQALVLTDHILGAFSQADDSLVAALMTSRPQEDATASPIKAGEDEDSAQSLGGHGEAPTSPRDAFSASLTQRREASRGGSSHADPFWQVTDDDD
jgi:hypothetical protein